MPGLSVHQKKIGSIFRAQGAAITSCRALPHEPLLLLQSDAYYESRVLWPCARDVPPSRDVRLHDAWPLHRDAGQHAYDVLLPSYDVLQLSLTCDFLQIGFLRFSGSRDSSLKLNIDRRHWFRDTMSHVYLLRFLLLFDRRGIAAKRQ
jgi:hypothetical protein